MPNSECESDTMIVLRLNRVFDVSRIRRLKKVNFVVIKVLQAELIVTVKIRIGMTNTCTCTTV